MIVIYALAALHVFYALHWSRQEWKRYTPGGPTIFRPVVNQRSIHG